MTLKHMLLAASLLLVVIIAIDLQMARKYYCERGVAGW
jgi:nitrogen fixation protein FixH